MKQSIRLYITGSVQSMFFQLYVKEHADKHNVRGFIRVLEDGRVEIFLEGNTSDVEAVKSVCKRGPQHAVIKSVEEKEEYFQDFKDFKILRI